VPRLPALGSFYRDNKGPTFEDHDVELARFNRWIGPSLAVSNVPDPLADPTLELHDGNGALLDSNDDWDLSPDQAEIQASGASPTNPKESAVLQILPAGPCTAIVRGVNNTTGVGSVEIYQLP
jgi:hypothetical protein